MTKKAPEVKRSPGVTSVPGSVNWHYVKKVPKELAEHPQYKGTQWAFRGSLGTSDLREANRRAAAKLVELEAHWARLKLQASPVKVTDLVPEQVTQLAEYIRFCVFNADDYRRDSPQVAHRLAVMRDLAAGKVSKDEALQALAAPTEQAYLTDHSAQALEDLNKARDTQAGRAMARRNPEAILPDAVAACEWLGVSYDWTQDGARPHLLKLLEAKRQALEDLTERDKGKVSPTPSEPQPEPPEAEQGKPKGRRAGQSVDILKARPSEVRLRDVFDDWCNHGKPGRKAYPPKTVGKYRLSLERFEALTEDPTMADVERVTGVEFRRAMLALSGAHAMTATTVRDTLVNVGTLLNYYSKETGRLASGLWENVSARLDTGNGQSSRDEWSEEELNKLFSLPVWQQYELPGTKNGGLDAAYWVPLLGLFTGCRVTELAQLRTDSLEQRGGVWFLRMEVVAESQTLKAAASWRVIPLARGLIDLGLIEYRQHIIDLGQDWLFPGVTQIAQNNAGGGLSRWFSDLKIKNGFRDDVVFHSLRGSLNTNLMRLDIPIEYRCKYIGQSPEGGVNVSNYNKLKPVDLLRVSDAIDFGYLNLPKVYTKPAWFPGWKE
jgi:integrase